MDEKNNKIKGQRRAAAHVSRTERTIHRWIKKGLIHKDETGCFSTKELDECKRRVNRRQCLCDADIRWMSEVVKGSLKDLAEIQSRLARAIGKKG